MRIHSLILLGLALPLTTLAKNYYAQGDDAAGDDAGDDGGKYYAAKDDDDAAAAYDGDDYIKYWTEYAVLPKKCITYNNVDMIVWSMYTHYQNHCTDKPIGTYMSTVPTFVSAWVDQMDLNSEDMQGDDYVTPDTTYVNCYPYQNNNGDVYYVQLGCTDGNSQSLSVNAYKDNTCTKPNTKNGYDDTNLDVSDLQLPFKQCQSCVYFVDKNEDDTDDQYFENRMTNAPLCSTIWANKDKCNGKCKRLGNDGSPTWNTSDKVLLTVLSIFSAGMLALIMKKRSKMSKKDILLEEAAMSAAGLQQTHIIGIFAITLLVIAMFGLLGLKSLTWTLLLLISTILFGYLMKLTIDSGMNVPIGPDGQVIPPDESSDEEDDDDDDEEDDVNGTYKSPEAPASSYQAPGAPGPSNIPPIT